MSSVCVILISLSIIYVDKAESGNQSQKLPLLPSEAILSVDKNRTLIRYCPDNTCNIIEAPPSVDKVAFKDFSVLFFSYASGYIYLDKSFDGKTPFRYRSQKKVREIISRLRQGCDGDDLAIVSCIMQRLARDHEIKTGFSRFDEGVEAITPYNPRVQYSLKNLRAIQDWYKKQ